MSQEFRGKTVCASNNVNRNATNLNLQDVIREMDKLLQQWLRPMEELIEQLEKISLEGQLFQRRHNSECEEEYDGEIDDEQPYERATRQGLRQQEPRNQRARPQVDGHGTYKLKSSFTPNERDGPSKNAKHIAETSKG
ncbi:hypothetical protein V6N11_044995 [Hibiscus sabdariffa]|uniref:Uncharacterized protein n=1 Tax=Hibiscus sabdariffa TaxID=183260 RepID=A0ABR2PUS4_9ROSI